MHNNDSTIISEIETEDLKKENNSYHELMVSDFAIKIYRGAVLPPNHPNYNNNRIKMEIYSVDFTKLNKCSIQFDGKDYNINSQNLFNRIKQYISDNLDILISWSISQTNNNLNNNTYKGAKSLIQIKYGQLIININGATTNLRDKSNEFIDELKNMIITDGEKSDEDFIKNTLDEFISKPLETIDEELENYCKLYEEKFGKKAYIAEPSGSREQTIEAIKTCLEKNEDILDKLLYPNLEEDLNNGFFYSETSKDLNKEDF